MKKINIGVVGAGYWGKKIIHECVKLGKQNSHITLSTVCDLQEENLKHCENYRIPSMTTDFKELVTSSDVDAITICTPNETHYDICRESLMAGKHVLVEKPMTLKSSEAYELVEIANKQNLVLSVGHLFRFNNALRITRNLIGNSFFGEIYYLDLQWTTRMAPIEGRDIITDLAPHPFDILHFLLRRWPLKITCKAKAYRRKKLEEMAYLLVEFDNEILAHLELSWLSPGKTRQVSVVGSKRVITIDCLSQAVQVFEKDSFRDMYVKRNNTIEEELEHFVNCVQNNTVVNNSYLNQSSGLIGSHVVKLLEVSRRSLEEEKTERVRMG